MYALLIHHVYFFFFLVYIALRKLASHCLGDILVFMTDTLEVQDLLVNFLHHFLILSTWKKRKIIFISYSCRLLLYLAAHLETFGLTFFLHVLSVGLMISNLQVPYLPS